jgi:gamma-glutamyltranspeptidase/glutathione hydrolase
MKGLSIFNINRDPNVETLGYCRISLREKRFVVRMLRGAPRAVGRGGGRSGCLRVVATCALLCLVWLQANATDAVHGMVASGHPLATEAGVHVLRNGGNAVDAAVAVALTLGVVDGDNAGVGGGCFILIRRPNGSFVAIDGRETAPAAATRDMFIRDGKGDTTLSQTGPLASGVPGALAAYEYAVKHYGKKPLRDLILPAADVAERGFKLDASYAARLQNVAADMGRFESSRRVFFKGLQPLTQGDTLKQVDLAESYRSIAREGAGWFYRGSFAKALEKWMKESGGIMTARDLREYKLRLREPLKTTYRGYTIVGFPPPSSGGVHVAQILNILERFNLRAMDDATRLHVIAEAMKLAFADRAYWLGDPDFAKVPRGLVDKHYAEILAAGISTQRVVRVASHGTPPGWPDNIFKKHTTHFSVADAEGNWVACTATVNTGFGSKVVIPGTGIVMNDEMDDFSIQPGVANFFGLVGAEANAVEAGKRPLSSMSPTIVLKDGQPIIAIGAAGGPKIISQVVLGLVNMLDLGFSPAEALARSRIHHQWSPDELMCERELPGELQNQLEKRGHKLSPQNGMGISQVVSRAPDGKAFLGAADPRGHGSAIGW